MNQTSSDEQYYHKKYAKPLRKTLGKRIKPRYGLASNFFWHGIHSMLTNPIADRMRQKTKRVEAILQQ